MTIHAVLLICALATQPPQCNIETAVSVSQGPKIANEIMCMKSGQEAMARNDWVAPREGFEYLKIQCVRVDDRV